jgi:hypothetical protein
MSPAEAREDDLSDPAEGNCGWLFPTSLGMTATLYRHETVSCMPPPIHLTVHTRSQLLAQVDGSEPPTLSGMPRPVQTRERPQSSP